MSHSKNMEGGFLLKFEFLSSISDSCLVVRFVAFTVLTMKNAVFWDKKNQFLPHRKHITSPLQGPAG
jgi:hypothetical protein